MKLYAIINTPLPWLITVCLVQGRLYRLNKAIDYLNLRLNKRIYQGQLRNWELERRLKALDLPTTPTGE